MNLYRLDTDSGLVQTFGRDYLTNNFRRAVDTAQCVASLKGEDVRITRISGGGQMKVTRTVGPRLDRHAAGA